MKDDSSALELVPDSKIDYVALEEARRELFHKRLDSQLRQREVGKIDSLRRVVLRLVVSSQYQEAASIIDEFLQYKSFYPALRGRAEPHARHAKELINAVRAKRNFPNLSQLSMAKQQEILDYAVRHFEELKYSLKSIEQILKDEAIRDIRSTVWVLKSATYVVMAIVGLFFIRDFSGSIGQSLWQVFNNITDEGYKSLMHFFSFL